MDKMPWHVRLGITLIGCSVIVYLIKLSLIDNLPGTIEYIFNSFGFLFINVLLVTLVINGLLTKRAKNERLEKLNMVIGIFFSEVGNELIRRIIPADNSGGSFGDPFLLSGKEKPDEKAMKQMVINHRFELDPSILDMKEMQVFLQEKRNFLLRLMENPVMLEHQSFTFLLQSTFHLAAELGHRDDPGNLSHTDRTHLTGDVSRVYEAITKEWISYMGYLYNNYPYLYSLAVRTNPYNPKASVEVT
ncbi:MAG: hypothetical protein GXY48_11180 [Methanomicrobiales archaeon]|nr:hypothetical protein [Methanomicrobiales archaeon]